MEFFDGEADEEERDFEEDLLKEGEEEDKGMDDSNINSDKIKE